MSVHFNADEILEIAEQIERNGARFYRRAAEGTDDSRRQEQFRRLAEMEDEHEKTFAAMRRELSKPEQAAITFDPDNQAALYLQAIADGHVFDLKADPAEKLTGQESVADILRTAIQAENASIAFYTGLMQMVPKDLGQDRVMDIIKEEMSHVTLLSKELAAAQA